MKKSLTAIIEIIAKNDKIVSVEEKLSKFENVCGVYAMTVSTDTIVVDQSNMVGFYARNSSESDNFI